MIVALLVGLVLGFFLSIPPGPIAIAVMRHALDGEDRVGLKIGLGAATMDTIYSLVAIFASSAFLSSLKSVFTGGTWLTLGFQVLCIATLVVLGMRYFKAHPKRVAATAQREIAQEERVHKMGYTSHYMMGVFMSITNLASPTFIPSLITVAGFMHAKGFVDTSLAQSVMYALGFGSGAALWFLVVLRVVYSLRARLSSNFVNRIYKFAGWSFVVFAAILAFHVVVGTKWSEL